MNLVHRINARAERRVEKELIGDLMVVPHKKSIFLKMVYAALARPDESVREVVYPVVPGGEKTLRNLVRELMASNRVIRERVRYQLRGSYTHYYRRMLGPVLAALTFRCNNTHYRPMMNAIDLLGRYAEVETKVGVYAAQDTVPIEGVVPKAWQDAVTDENGRIERIPYELCVLIALREALRGGRSTSRARAAGAIPMRTCPTTSTTTATCTTPRWANPCRPRSSWLICDVGTKPRWTG